MAITRNQANAAMGRACRKMAALYWEYDPNVTRAVVRTLVSEAKRVGTPAARKAVKAILREMYMDIFTDDPVGKRHFIQWLRSALTEQPSAPIGLADQPFNTVSLGDSFVAELEEITG